MKSFGESIYIWSFLKIIQPNEKTKGELGSGAQRVIGGKAADTFWGLQLMISK